MERYFGDEPNELMHGGQSMALTELESRRQVDAEIVCVVGRTAIVRTTTPVPVSSLVMLRSKECMLFGEMTGICPDGQQFLSRVDVEHRVALNSLTLAPEWGFLS